MQTTLRINDEVFREAKAEAAREGMTLTRFLEEALAFRVRAGRQSKAAIRPDLPSYDSGKRLPGSYSLPDAIRDAEAGNDHKVLANLMRPASKAGRS